MQVKPSLLKFTPSPKALFLTSCLPLFIGILCQSILCFTGALFVSHQNSHKDPQENLFLLFIKEAQDISYGVYGNFVSFLVAILIIHLIKTGIQRLRSISGNNHLTPNEDKKSFNLHSRVEVSKFDKVHSAVLRVLGYALAYSALYYIYFIIGTEIGKIQSLKLQGSDISGYFTRDLIPSPSRILEEEDRPMKRNSSTFPFGRVLGRLNLDGASIVLSKDETHLLACGQGFFGFQDVDISDLENPTVTLDYKVASQHDNMQKVSLLLSPGDKALFASNMNMDSFGKFDLTGSYFPSKSFSEQGVQSVKDLTPSYPASLAVSPDGTKIFISGFGFQVWNVSITNQTHLIKHELPTKEYNLSSVALSSDGKSLFLINGTLLNIYNITNLEAMDLLFSLKSENTPCSFIQSKDKRVLTIIGFQKGTNKVVIEKVDVSNVKAPLLIKTFSLNVESFSPSFELGESPKGTYLYFTVKESDSSAETRMIVFDPLTEKLLEDNQGLISKAKSLLFTSNEMNLMVVYDEYIASVQLYPSSVNDRIFSISKETFAQISGVPKGSNRILQVFSSVLLSVDEVSSSAGSRFTFTNISDKSLPNEINSFSAGSHPISVKITNDAKTLCAIFPSGIFVYDISDLKSINLLGSYAFSPSLEVKHAVFTSDGKTCFMAASNRISYSLVVFDLSDPASIREVDTFYHLYFGSTSKHPLLILSQDEKALIVVDLLICILDVSARKINKTDPYFVMTDSVDFAPSSVSLSPNGKTLIIKKEDLHSSSLRIFDVSNLTRVLPKRTFALPKPKTVRNISVGFSPDSKFVYVEGIHGGQPSLMVLNISNLSSPIFQSVVQAEGLTEGSVDNFIISDDGKTAYLSSNSENKIYVVNLEVQNTVFLGTESFRLGEKLSTNAKVLTQNSRGDYIPLTKNFKFIKASLFSTKILPTEPSTQSRFTTLPDWMAFAKETGNFVVEPKKQTDLGTYTLYSGFSTQLNRSSFNRIERFKGNVDQIQGLLGTLVSFGYLDSELYVTGNLGTLENFFLTIPESPMIYQILKENCFETWTSFDIVPSLEMRTSRGKLEVHTPSPNSLKIEILFMGKDIHFLKKQYGPLLPLITENKTKLSMEGSLDDVNNALKSLVVNSEVEEDRDCEGTIIIWDHLNPLINKTLKNLSSYFKANEAPLVNPKEGFDVQSQINSRAIYTGEYFSLILFNNTFIDKHTETLSFTLTLNNQERSPAPSWLTFNDLILKGTPPEEFLGRHVNLLLTVKNEFKRREVPFDINIKLSPMFVLKSLVKYSPYILTILGLWVFANRIYNVVKKDKYRHQKDFYLSVGQEITSENIYPISFIGQEGAECDLIWRHLEKEGLLDKSSLIGEIKKFADERNLPLYKNGSDLSRKLIHQLIFNRMALWLIDSEQEKETKRIYEEEIEDHLMDLVRWDGLTGYCQINESKLTEILNKKKKNVLGENSIKKEEEGLETGLISQRSLNVDLLKDVVIAEAMRCQSVRKRAVFTHVIIKEEVPANWIKRFLKKNLYDLPSVQGQKMAYGIEYGIKNDVLYFSGVAEEKLCGRTLAIQITDLRHKILKEVWIHGVKNKKNDHDDELEAQGKKYEML